jgi:hypothetical protein
MTDQTTAEGLAVQIQEPAEELLQGGPQMRDYPREQAVTLAYVCSNDVGYAWHHSMVELLGWDLAHFGRVHAGGYAAIRYGTDGLVEARNRAVEDFLADDQADWLFWVDTDMGFAPDTVDRLFSVAHPTERPVVGGLCFVQREVSPDGTGGRRTEATPTVYDWLHVGEKQGFAVRWDYPRDTLVRCSGTGSACVLVHRSVFTKMFERYGRSWYDRAYNPSMKQNTGEDLSFCMRAGALGIPVHVHTGVRASHQKTVWLSEHEFDQQRPAPPATAEVAVIVPVLGRPGNAEPFMRSLRASTGLARAYAVYSAGDDDTVLAWKDAGAELVNGAAEDVTEQGRPLGNFDFWAQTFAQKVNLGYRQTREPWLFLTGDDVRFWPGWLDHVQRAAGSRYHVVGTNDLGNPRVTSGEHATHLLVRRVYVDELGASWDGPGVVAHESYGHWFVDDEVVTVAKQRGVWTPCLSAKVEHQHPLYGKAEMDDTYRLGLESAEADKALFGRRCTEHGVPVADER